MKFGPTAGRQRCRQIKIRHSLVVLKIAAVPEIISTVAHAYLSRNAALSPNEARGGGAFQRED